MKSKFFIKYNGDRLGIISLTIPIVMYLLNLALVFKKLPFPILDFILINYPLGILGLWLGIKSANKFDDLGDIGFFLGFKPSIKSSNKIADLAIIANMTLLILATLLLFSFFH